MSRIPLKSAQNDILRHMRLGKDIRSPGGLSLVRNFILACDAKSDIHVLCRRHHVNVSELSAACVEVLARDPADLVPEPTLILASTVIFCNPGKLEEFLKKVRVATQGQTLFHRRAAIVKCAQAQSRELAASVVRPTWEVTQSHLFKVSIHHQLLLGVLIAGIIIGGILIAAYKI